MEKARTRPNAETSYERIFKEPRLEPVEDISRENGKPFVTHVCPTCGNAITRANNKYTCGACRQRLAWPGIDYTEYDARMAENAERYARNKQGGKEGSRDGKDGESG